jgi:uncharacterized protein YdaU (DUF1376 family)
MSGKLPWMKFYPADWSQDTTPLSLAGRGAWITIVCAMWRSAGRGKISMPLAGFCRLLGTTETEASMVIDELIKTGICNAVTGHDKNITLSCRRMVREEKHRNNNALRQKHYRVTHTSNAYVTGEKQKQKQISEAEADKNKKETVFEIPLKLNTPEFLKAWEDWKTHRKEIKAPLTPKSIEMQMKDFTTWGVNRAIAAIEFTIKKGWQGIREDDNGGYRKSNTPRKPASDIKTELILARGRIVKSLRELKAAALTPADYQDGVKVLSDKYRDTPGVLKEALEIVGV